MKRTWLLLLAAIFVVGCEDEPVPDPEVDPAPEVVPPAETPATRASAGGGDAAAVEDEPMPAVVSVGRGVVTFPPAVLHLLPGEDADGDEGGSTRAILFSDDPEEAMDRDWVGDSFYFEMTFDGDPDRLLEPRADGTLPVWEVRVPGSERRETRNGVFLNGGAVTLQPVDAEVVIVPAMGEVGPSVEVAGSFRRFASPSDDVGVLVDVRARVYPVVQVRD